MQSLKQFPTSIVLSDTQLFEIVIFNNNHFFFKNLQVSKRVNIIWTYSQMKIKGETDNILSELIKKCIWSKRRGFVEWTKTSSRNIAVSFEHASITQFVLVLDLHIMQTNEKIFYNKSYVSQMFLV